MAHVVDLGGRHDQASIALETRERTWIPNFRRKERAPEALRAAVEIWREAFPGNRLRSSTATYNCYGMVFASRRTWVEVDDDELRVILDDDNYNPFENRNQAEIGDLVIYRDAGNEVTHVGVIVGLKPDFHSGELDITVMSKWGHDGEYIHPLNAVPNLLGKAAEFYSERRPEP